MPSLERGQSAMCGCVGQKLARGSFVGAAPCSSSVLSVRGLNLVFLIYD
jgi:hypothetical protein